jgi:chromosome segregation ATPase
MLSQTSKVIVGIIVDQLEKGDIKGLEEYGISIDEADDIIYNWQLEAMAELTDALKYQQKEIAKLKAENIKLKAQPRFKLEEENLKLIEENEKLKRDIKTMKYTINRYNHDLTECESENIKLKKIVKSWEDAVKNMSNRIRGGK